MSKQEQILIIEPQNELKFVGPFCSPVTSFMKLINPSDQRVCFKIKTTAPKKYCVRPNSGILDPKSSVDIAVCLQPFEYDPNEKNKHKFMVQTMFAPDGDINMDSLWKDAKPEKFMDSKLKCVFELPPPPENNQDPNCSVNEEKPKRTGSAFREILFAGQNTSAYQGELAKAATEVRFLREEESSLRQENIQLKEEILRLRRSAASSGTSAPAPLVNTAAPSTGTIPMYYLIIALGAVFFGVIVGKFIL
ncbi:vesicle-associated membrane protein-associated protein B [Hetaerina americana]|uniref:vesicle-associated membrane protein-associated protein B n=1 Tax=Hetaerina americana TaxID=62018 RepID=UPI003A7F3D6A